MFFPYLKNVIKIIFYSMLEYFFLEKYDFHKIVLNDEKQKKSNSL